jgi:hypothetical protein
MHWTLYSSQRAMFELKSQTPLTVRLPNGATMESSHTPE